MPLHRSLGKERNEEGDRQRKKRQRSRRPRHHNVDGNSGDELVYKCASILMLSLLLSYRSAFSFFKREELSLPSNHPRS